VRDARRRPGLPGRRFWLSFSGTLLLGVLLVVGASLAVDMAHRGRVMPGVRVSGVLLAGLDRAAAESRLRAQLPALGGGGTTVSVDGTPVRLSNEDLARAYDIDRMLDGAFAVARGGDAVSDGVDRLRSLYTTRDLPVSLAAIDTAAVDRAVARIVDRFTVEPRSAAIRANGTRFAIERSLTGARLDAGQLRSALIATLSSTSAEPSTIRMSTDPVEPELTTAEARSAVRVARAMTARALVLQAGDETFKLSPAQLVPLVEFDTADGVYSVSMDAAGLRQLVRPLRSRVAQDPRDAWFATDGGRIVAVIPARDGFELNVRRSVAEIVRALQDRAAGGGGPVSLVMAPVAPRVPTDQADAAIPRLELLGTWTTYYVPGEGNFWNANIHIPAWDLDGHVVSPGEWFSFWNDIGPVTLERGYGYGGVILGGRSVANGAIAGGICSTSTTLFNAAMRAGLDIGQRVNHSYYIERYPVGLDATVLKTSRSVTDMTFRNDTVNPVVIRSYTGNGWVRFDVWGVSDGRTVSLSAPTTWNHVAAIDTVVVNPELAPGTAVRVEYPHNGFTALVTRTVRDARGAILHSDVWQSFYRVVTGITEVGPST
jgi:vancomycin resistance protein YoaR